MNLRSARSAYLLRNERKRREDVLELGRPEAIEMRGDRLDLRVLLHVLRNGWR